MTDFVYWTGASGRQYEFQLDPIGTAYKERPGVYIFCKAAANGSYNACYIGETENFRGRLTGGLLGHHRWDSIRAAGATHICTLHVPGAQALREGIETDLRRAIPTPCNLQ